MLNIENEFIAHEPEAMTAEEWKEGGYYSVTITADPGDAAEAKQETAGSYEEYIALREGAHAKGLYIVSESFITKEQYFPGLLTYNAAVDIFANSNDSIIEMKSFPEFCKRAKIKQHDSVVLAADTGGGKSSLAINFIDELNGKYPVLYFNLEMDDITVMRRLVSIHTGMELDRIEGYKNDKKTAAAVNAALSEITAREPLQVISNVYDLEGIEALIKHSIQFRPEDIPTIVIIDHSLLVQTSQKANGRYERFTTISERLRAMAKDNNIILFVLLQQNREGKKDDAEPPKNWSLKESGSWENDATHIIFLWWNPEINKKQLIITKNRGGESGTFTLEYNSKTQVYREEKMATGSGSGRLPTPTATIGRKKNAREKRKDRLDSAIETATLQASLSGTTPTLHDIAEVLGVTTATVKGWIKEFGGYDINGIHYDPAGIEDTVEGEGFTRLTPTEEQEAINNYPTPTA